MNIDRVLEIEKQLSKLDTRIRASQGNVASMKFQREQPKQVKREALKRH